MRALSQDLILPTLMSITDLNVTNSPSDSLPFWQRIEPGTTAEISEADVYQAYMLGLTQGSSRGLPMSVDLSLPDGNFSISAPALPREYRGGALRPYWDTVPWSLPYEYPINVTFIIAGQM